MKISSVIYPVSNSVFKSLRLGTLVGFSMLPLSSMSFADVKLEADVFEYKKNDRINEEPILELGFPTPILKIANEYKLASIVVDTDKNKLYHYDKEGSLIKEYSVATGKKSTPTDKGIRKVSWVENYPYRNAPAVTKRRKAPWEYGPKVIVIGIVDPSTGEITRYNGEFIHGTNKPESIGTHASHGCIRLNNEDIKELAAQMEKGMYVVIK